MPKVIQNLELLKKLQPYIKGDTEYYRSMHNSNTIEYKEIKENDLFEFVWVEIFKTLTTEEIIELLPEYTHLRQIRWWEWLCDNKRLSIKNKNIWWKTPLEALEKMLNYLINNNLMEVWEK